MSNPSRWQKSRQLVRILIIDDEQPILFATEQYFTTLGYEVDTAAERETAEALLVSTQYSVVIADLRLTSVDGREGLELVSFIRQLDARTPIIVLTAFGSSEIEQEAYDRGADVFLSKPQPLPALHAIINKLLESHSV